ncbi:c-type cytochrome domain-containing protein [Verrucomicrobium spinosum]|uniref:c-type cytochrome domain-containing protein n=1 Tax=Verrucomicrobium spinosum TaxID=2736 RepID=UPI0018DDF496|nr:c-type cytochrome domain-containing protein [Verrucomicrobium spinosum]
MKSPDLKPQTSRSGYRPGAWGLVLGVLLAPWLQGAEPTVSFQKDIAPILADKCLTCHQEKKAKGGYRVDTFEHVTKAGDSELAPLTARKPDASTLFTRLVTADEDERMPANDDPLPPEQVALVKRWIEQGSKFDGSDARLALNEVISAASGKTSAKAPEKYPRPLPITAAVMAGDGQTAFTSGYHEVLEWSVPEGRLQRRFKGLPERVLGLALQRSGRLLAVAGGSPGRGGELLVVERASGRVVKRLPGSKDTVLAVGFSPDGSLLAAGGTDNTVRVYYTSDWTPAWKAEAHADWVTSLTFAPDGKHVVSTSRDRTAKVLASEDGSPGLTFANHGSAVTSAVFDADGATVTTSAADGEVRRWKWDESVDGGGRTKDKLLKGGRQEVTRVVLGSGKIITASVDGRLRQYDLAKLDAPAVELTPLGVRIDALTPDDSGWKLLAAGQDGRLQILDLGAGQRLLSAIAAPGW